MDQKSPVFIAFDGIDGVGKSTQIETLSRFLDQRGSPHCVTRDPGSTEIGKRIRSLLLEGSAEMHRRTEAMLFMASRCEMVETVIRPNLSQGKSVISDRFLLANVVYQSVGSDGQPAADAEMLWRLGAIANDGVRPDLTVLLDMPAEAAMARVGEKTDRMESRGVAYMESVRQAFLRELPKASDATLVVDASRTPEEVSEQIRTEVTKLLSPP